MLRLTTTGSKRELRGCRAAVLDILSHQHRTPEGAIAGPTGTTKAKVSDGRARGHVNTYNGINMSKRSKKNN